MKISEDNFIEQLKLHNEDALIYLIDEYGWIVKSILYKQLKEHPRELEECMNDIFLNIWNNIGSFDNRKAKFQTWIAVITKYRAIDYLRKIQITPIYEDVDEIEVKMEDKGFNKVLESDAGLSFYSMLSGLKEQDKKMFYKLYYEEKSCDEVSEELGMKKSVLYNRLLRGKKKLRQFLEGGYAE